MQQQDVLAANSRTIEGVFTHANAAVEIPVQHAIEQLATTPLVASDRGRAASPMGSTDQFGSCLSISADDLPPVVSMTVGQV